MLRIFLLWEGEELPDVDPLGRELTVDTLDNILASADEYGFYAEHRGVLSDLDVSDLYARL